MINSGERGFGLPKFSRDERTRRWGRVRALMPADAPDSIRYGDTVVIRKEGARRLGKKSSLSPNYLDLLGTGNSSCLLPG